MGLKPAAVDHPVHALLGTGIGLAAVGCGGAEKQACGPSMGSVGDAYDDATCESFFAILECELLACRRCASQAEARRALFS